MGFRKVLRSFCFSKWVHLPNKRTKNHTTQKIIESESTIILFFSASIPPPPSPEPPGVCPNSEWIPRWEYCYYVDTKMRHHWPVINLKCLERGAQIVSVHSAEEDAWLLHQIRLRMTYARPSWLGLVRRHSGQ